jgi:hypothetical protein
MLRRLLVLFILFFPRVLIAQTPAIAYSRVDSLAFTIKYENDITLLTKKLTTPFSDPFLKTRAIFVWITRNIEYDYKFYNKYEYKGREPKGFHCEGDSTECDIKRQVWENQYVLNVLDKRKAVCQGYSMLFKKMCNIAGLQCWVVPGYVRTEDYEVGTPGELDHAWNVILLNGVYYPLDATWAAGSCSKDEVGKLIDYIPNFKAYYWLTPPEKFARNHFPEDPKWVLIHNFTIEKFSANPYYSPGYIDAVDPITPSTGIIKAKKGDTIRFKLKHNDHIEELQINTNLFTNPDVYVLTKAKKKWQVVIDTPALKEQQYIAFKYDNGLYEFAYVVKDSSLDHIDIIFDTKRVMRFKVKMQR